MLVNDRHREAKELREQRRYEEAMKLCNELIDENPDDATALFILGGLFVDNERKGLAYNIFARVCKLAPEAPEGWIMYGRTQADSKEGWDKSQWCFEKGIELNPNSLAAYTNLASLMIQKCEPQKAFPYLKKALDINPDDPVARSCKGFAHLMMGEWKQAWKYYHAMLGHRSRPRHMDDLPEWDGTPGHTVLVDGEQGIGDEIVYASVIPDLMKDCKVVYNCMPKLETLMKRSFPDAYVTGSRWTDVVVPEAFTPTAKIPQAGVCMFYRNKDEDFPGTPYLKADPVKQQGIRAILDGLGPNPKVGIAWTGGTKRSRCQFRQFSLEEFLPVLQVPGVDFVSLQYKDPSDELAAFQEKHGITIHHYDWITEAKDYDLTAALVSELDLVIAVPTSATQLTGALGKEAWVLVPEITGWLFYQKEYKWANSLRLFHDWTFAQIGDELRKRYGTVELRQLANSG